MKYIKRRGFIILCMVLSLSSSVYGAEIKAPDVKALGAILMDLKTGRVLWEKNAYEPLSNASTTKIITCILAIESGTMDDTVVVSSNAAGQPKVKMGLSTDEEVKMKDLLYALMMRSSNDAAVAIAEHISGSEEAFCELMTRKAIELGAKDTIFETPNGLDKGEHHSTAYDMAIITCYVLNNEEFVGIINESEISFSSNLRTYSMTNTNRLLNEYSGAIGVKTGFTNKAGHCFVGAAERDGMTLVTVVLGSGWGNVGKQRKWTDTKNLLDYGFNHYKYYDICVKGDYITTLPVDNSYRGSIVVNIGESIILPLNEKECVNILVELKLPDSVAAPVEIGHEIGLLIFKLEDGSILEHSPLVAENAVIEKNLLTSMRMLIKYWINPFKSVILS